MKANQTDSGRPTSYISGIDGLRAIAVLMVLAYHLKLPFAKGGLLGVTVFFVISGFLITRILLTELEDTNAIDLGTFWMRRIRRLLPAILTMATALIFVSAVFNRVLFTKACSDLPSVIFCYNNWRQIFNNVSYFENAGAPSPLTHCWSLAIETQFYLLYPLLLIFLSRFRDKKSLFVRVTMILAVLSAALMWILFDPSKDPSRVYYGTDTRVFSLLFGALLALLTNKRRFEKRISVQALNVIGAISFAGLLYMMIAIDGYSSFLYRGGQVLVSLLAVLIIFSVLNPKSIPGRILSAPLLKWIGDRSYSIYLWHFPIILLISNGKKSSWWIDLIEILLTVVFASLSYAYVETPIRHGVIQRSIAIIRSRPRTRRERRRQILTLKKGLKVVSGTFVITIGALMCIAFVPREKTLDHIEDLEAQAKEAAELTEQKAAQTKKETGNTKEDGSKTKGKSEAEILQTLDLLLIGDSIALGASDEFYETFPNSISDAAVSRYTTESFVIYDSYVKEKDWDGDGVIFALGSNGLLYDSLETLRGMIDADKPLFIITARAPYASWEESNNQEMYEFAETSENTYLVDWYKASEGHGEYFIEDETHLTDEGAQAYIECIKEAVLKIYADEKTL